MDTYEFSYLYDVDDSEPIDPLDFIARVLIHIPEPKKHLISTGPTPTAFVRRHRVFATPRKSRQRMNLPLPAALYVNDGQSLFTKSTKSTL